MQTNVFSWHSPCKPSLLRDICTAFRLGTYLEVSLIQQAVRADGRTEPPGRCSARGLPAPSLLPPQRVMRRQPGPPTAPPPSSSCACHVLGSANCKNTGMGSFEERGRRRYRRERHPHPPAPLGWLMPDPSLELGGGHLPGPTQVPGQASATHSSSPSQSPSPAFAEARQLKILQTSRCPNAMTVRLAVSFGLGSLPERC